MALLLKDIREVFVCDDKFTRIKNVSIYVEEDKIKKIGKLNSGLKGVKIIDCSDYICLPGFVDSHTHLIYAGERVKEFELKLMGVPYLEILKRGGGILSTVRKTREAKDDELEENLLERLNLLIKEGTTTCEIKTGYGLSLRDEERLLKILLRVKKRAIQDIAITYMGAHAVPEGVSKEKYIREIIDEGIPMASSYAEFCDVFCEKGVFTYRESKKILERAMEYGLLPKVHADELSDSNGAYLAGEVKAISCEHMVYSNLRGLRKMRENGVISVLLPATSFFLRKRFANAERIKKEGIRIALATDHNPGTSPCYSLLTVAKIALFRMNLDLKDVILGITLNSARAIKRENILGSIEEGKQADFVLFKVPDIHFIFYNFDFCFERLVIKRGRLVYKGV